MSHFGMRPEGEDGKLVNNELGGDAQYFLETLAQSKSRKVGWRVLGNPFVSPFVVDLEGR